VGGTERSIGHDQGAASSRCIELPATGQRCALEAPTIVFRLLGGSCRRHRLAHCDACDTKQCDAESTQEQGTGYKRLHSSLLGRDNDFNAAETFRANCVLLRTDTRGQWSRVNIIVGFHWRSPPSENGAFVVPASTAAKNRAKHVTNPNSTIAGISMIAPAPKAADAHKVPTITTGMNRSMFFPFARLSLNRLHRDNG
jgi:hypothetical protein